MARLADSTRLTVAMIVRDAAARLAVTLQSVEPIADEFVIVDTGSRDETRALALQAKARLFSFSWNDDFSAARNFCLTHARGSWILWLDAGEQLTPADGELLRRYVNGSPDPTTVHAVLIRIPQRGAAGCTEQIAQLRLVPNHPEVRFGGRVRETLWPSVSALSLRIDSLPVCLERGPQDHLPEIKAARARRNLRLAELEMRDVGPQSRLWNCVGDAWQTLEDYARAEQSFQCGLAAAEPGSPEMLEAYYGILTSRAHQPGGCDGLLDLCRLALEVFPLDVQLLCAIGGLLQKEGRWDLAARAYQTAYQFGQIHPLVWHVGEAHEIAASCYIRMLRMLGRAEEAARTCAEAITRYPTSPHLRQQWIGLQAANEKEFGLAVPPVRAPGAVAFDLLDSLPAVPVSGTAPGR